MIYNWEINGLEVYTEKNSFSDVVYNVHWELTATDDSDTYTAEVIGVQSLDFNDNGDFIPFNEITKETVISWLEDSDLNIEKLKEVLDRKISEQITPKSSIKNLT